jgi:hypothetical protein
MIYCVDFSHPSFGLKVRSITVEAVDAAQARTRANEVAKEVLNWPIDIVDEGASLVWHDYFRGDCSP